MTKIQLPALHGVQHLPDGSDPIPGITIGTPGFATYIRSFTSLQAWWRLGLGDGDPITSATDALDSSGKNRPLTGASIGTPVPTHIAHADLGGDDDKATQFNFPQTTTTGGSGGSYFFSAGPIYSPSSGDSGWTMLGFVRPLDPAAGSTYKSIPFGHWNLGGTPSGGAAFLYQPATGAISAIWQSGVSVVTVSPSVNLALATWYLLALVWDNTADTVTMYINGTAVATQPAAFLAASQAMFIGAGDQSSSGSNYPCHFYGAVDEVALFSAPLTAADIAGFATAAGAAAGSLVASDPIWDTKGDLAVATGADAAAKFPVGTTGQVLTADSTQTQGVKWAAVPAATLQWEDV